LLTGSSGNVEPVGPAQLATAESGEGGNYKRDFSAPRPSIAGADLEGQLHRLSYHSHALTTSAAGLDAIYAESAAFNASVGITGALLFADGRFVQILEGDQAAITSLYERITRDPRHDHVTFDYLIEVPSRLFPDWSMARITDDKTDIPMARILSAAIAADYDTSIRQLRSLARTVRAPLSDPDR
jgi:FAD-dependent sensor of blue light